MSCMVSVRSAKSPRAIAASIGKVIVGTSLILLLPFVATACGSEGSDPSAKITTFEPASGTYKAGDEVVSSLSFENTSDDKSTFWVGYSVQDTLGRWHDAPVKRVTLEPGESASQKSSWRVPEDPAPPSGFYKVAMAVWEDPPERSSEEERLEGVQSEDAFQVAGLQEEFESLENRWRISSKELGRGRLEPENVSLENERLRLKLPADSFDGGEIRSRKLYQYGSYRARIKVADAPSSLTGFFLYKEPDFENELDIEIFNDPAGRILFTTYSNGRETNNVEKELPFDPTADFHDYRFDFSPDRAGFYVDGELMHSFDKGLPQEPMNLYINAWFPTWLGGKEPETDSYTHVDWLRH